RNGPRVVRVLRRKAHVDDPVVRDGRRGDVSAESGHREPGIDRLDRVLADALTRDGEPDGVGVALAVGRRARAGSNENHVQEHASIQLVEQRLERGTVAALDARDEPPQPRRARRRPRDEEKREPREAREDERGHHAITAFLPGAAQYEVAMYLNRAW